MVDRPSIRKRLCERLTVLVISLQAAFLLTLWVTPTWTPPRLKFFELIWAWMHRPTFYPLMALLAAGPVLTIVAWLHSGRHRAWLALGWLGFSFLLFKYHHERVVAMARVLWWIWMG